MSRIIEKTIDPSGQGRKIGEFILRMGLSNSALKKLRYTEGAILLNGRPVFSSSRLNEGDRLTLILAEKYRGHVRPEEIPITVLYEDEDFLVIDKPPFLPMHPTKGHSGGTLANAVIAYNLARGLDCPFRTLGRLDAMTSGIVVTARNLAAASARLEDKRYIALTAGRPEPPCGEIRLPIRRAETGSPKRGIFEDGREAVTLYETLEDFGGAALVTFRLLTGRTHQIRVHSAAAGFPVLGDEMYGESSPLIGRQALHATAARVICPPLDKAIELQSPLPGDISAALERLRRDIVDA